MDVSPGATSQYHPTSTRTTARGTCTGDLTPGLARTVRFRAVYVEDKDENLPLDLSTDRLSGKTSLTSSLSPTYGINDPGLKTTCQRSISNGVWIRRWLPIVSLLRRRNRQYVPARG